MQVLKTLGMRIRAQRRANMLTQEDVCGLTNLDRSFLSEIETGKINPSVLVLMRIAQALGTSASSLLDGLGPE